MPALHAVHKKAANSRSALYVALLFLLAGLLLAGCSAKTAPKPIGSPERPGIYDPAMLTHIKDFDRLPQDLTVYAQNAPKFDLRDEQAQAAARFIRLFFSPWAQTSSSVSVKDAAWAERIQQIAGKFIRCFPIVERKKARRPAIAVRHPNEIGNVPPRWSLSELCGRPVCLHTHHVQGNLPSLLDHP